MFMKTLLRLINQMDARMMLSDHLTDWLSDTWTTVCSEWLHHHHHQLWERADVQDCKVSLLSVWYDSTRAGFRNLITLTRGSLLWIICRGTSNESCSFIILNHIGIIMNKLKLCWLPSVHFILKKLFILIQYF